MVNSSLPRLLAELIRLRVYKFFATLYVHRSEAQIADGTAPRYHQVNFNSEHLPFLLALAALTQSSIAHHLCFSEHEGLQSRIKSKM